LWTDGRTYGRVGRHLRPTLLGWLGGVDLKMRPYCWPVTARGQSDTKLAYKCHCSCAKFVSNQFTFVLVLLMLCSIYGNNAINKPQKLPSTMEQIPTTSKVNEQVVLSECNSLRHLFNQFKACFSIDLTQYVRQHRITRTCYIHQLFITDITPMQGPHMRTAEHN